MGMKLSSSLIFLFGVASAANFSKCPDNMCQRRCKDGFVPQKPKKVICNKNEKGKFKWSGELGGCKAADAATTAKPDVTTVADNGATKSCKAIELKGSQIKSGVTMTTKVDSSGKDIAVLTCPEGSLFNGKKGATKKKLKCKCGASGKCKWKN